MNRKSVRVLIPLLQVLKSMKAENRIILLAHLDDVTRDGIYKTISEVLTSQKIPTKKRKFLKRKLLSYKKQLRRVAFDKANEVSKRRSLMQIGGSPMSYVLNSAIPLLLEYFAK